MLTMPNKVKFQHLVKFSTERQALIQNMIVTINLSGECLLEKC